VQFEAAIKAQAGLIEDMDQIARDLSRAFPAE